MGTIPISSEDQGVLASSTHAACEFVQVLMKMQRAAQLITSTLDLEQILDRVVNDLASSLGSVEVAIWLRHPDTDEMVLQGVRGCKLFKKGSRLKIGREGIVGRVSSTGQMYYAPDVRLDPYYIACEPETRSEASIPMKIGGQVIGVFSVDHTEVNAFSENQLLVLEALAGHIAVAIENARLFQLERVERERMQQEADDARAMQQALFLKATPLVRGFTFETAWHPAGSVAGDWFDFIDLGDERYGIVLADVSGKGMSAALLMSATRAILRSLVKLHPSPGETLAHLNQTLLEDFPPGKFVTMIYAVLDANSREVTIASAGHLRPLVINRHNRFLDVEPGLPLGLAAGPYPETTLRLDPGTHLLFYTDGITEATNGHEEEYGANRLLEHFQQYDACVNGLIDEVREFGEGSIRADDATAVLIRSR
ncbi:GAF domain-containing SpoIIE family protein phosphatase [Alloacidobacterium sp.]|uniref:GAF domain-containing SpoIIE family protein phosphatase n=1 Tax=Alloacidobacterium sp. TaxID=2951999 RepID=UPI002D248E20|nr:GAF domain-containing SpoIIE family protein phosphatase [Alloacidobacterium sp.]HYK38045.1 GAF domain-containing SpoIIE family protein phosphatase [Alloacidobacterium sp.]